MLARLTSVIAIVAIVTTACGDHLTAPAPQPSVTVSPKPTTLLLAELIKSGKLRAAFNQLNITCVQTNARGETGLCVEIARELATQLHSTLVTSTSNNGAALMDAGRAGEWDVAFEQTYLVRGDSPGNSVADLDRADVRIASFSPSPIEVFLKQNLKYATVIDVPSIAHGVTLIEHGEAHAYAGLRDEVDDGGWRLANGRVRTDSITRFRWGVVMTSGRSDLFAYVTQFLDSSKKNGFIQDAIETSKVSGARVAR